MINSVINFILKEEINNKGNTGWSDYLCVHFSHIHNFINKNENISSCIIIKPLMWLINNKNYSLKQLNMISFVKFSLKDNIEYYRECHL